MVFIALSFVSQVKVVIVDSITFHFRQEFEDMALRTRLLSGMALKLMKLAKKFNIAVRTSAIWFRPNTFTFLLCSCYQCKDPHKNFTHL